VAIPSSDEQVQFLLRVQRLLAEGNFVATYKHALLLSIADICIEEGDDSGNKLRITTGELAEKFISYYWRQSVPYHPAGRPSAILKQNTGRQAAVISSIIKAREAYGGSLPRLRNNAAAWRKLTRDVAETIRVMPLWKLQTVGRVRIEFLYDHDPREGHEILLKEGVCFCFRLFYGLVHELVRGAWLRFVRGVSENRLLLGDTTDISDFMFGSGRAPLDVYKPLLIEYQGNRCFYCLRPLKDKTDVDHFIPWSRYPVDLGHNFVLAHGSCNAQKSNRLAAVEHLERWCDRNIKYGQDLVRAFRERSIVHDEHASWQITAWAYSQAQAVGSLVWLHGNELVALSSEWEQVVLQSNLKAL
jgi:HNH endonuclease